ncbi:hypothetical protein CC86DRAFT_411348 [Ophiobolus disseminans]|uniref:RING-type domain-containing protein n=1 Tax=Ophiobolus disseminans TaxID=1469910 RepID=A0A6A6ZL10_9PLEO|nr:hypothetical protein CC86DRAFT_411348 [Ophiobolus disseminans]
MVYYTPCTALLDTSTLDDCPICREPFNSPEGCYAVRLNDCGHVVGFKCFQEWAQRVPGTCVYWSHKLPVYELPENLPEPEPTNFWICETLWFRAINTFVHEFPVMGLNRWFRWNAPVRGFIELMGVSAAYSMSMFVILLMLFNLTIGSFSLLLDFRCELVGTIPPWMVRAWFWTIRMYAAFLTNALAYFLVVNYVLLSNWLWPRIVEPQ